MIRNQWYPILLPEDMSDDKPTGVRRMGENLVVWRDIDGNLVCQQARCPHKGADLGDGRLKGNSVECRYHGFRYGPDGKCVAVPALGSDAHIPPSLKIKNYPVREVNGLIWMWWGDDREVLPDVQVPTEVADNPRLYSTMHWTRPVHYTRYIESVLEFYHVTYVHRDHWFNYVDYLFLYGTLRKFGLDGRERYLAATKVENSHLEVDGQTLRYAFDHVEEEDPANLNHYDVIFTFPSMSHIVSKQFEVTAWFAPIDDEHTEIFLRWYEFPRLTNVLRSKRLRRLIPHLSLYMEKWVQDPQDVRVMLRQEPKQSARGASKFIPVDELNAKYVQLRTKLLQEGLAGTGDEPAEPDEASAIEPAEPAEAPLPAAASSNGVVHGNGHGNGVAKANGSANGAKSKPRAADGNSGTTQSRKVRTPAR